MHPDHLGSPRAITRPSDNALVWKWDAVEPFGNNAANENPSGLGNFLYNLRHPGQYADQETGTFYNVNRDYDSTTGRYLQSDPIGLRGGLNTFAYTKSNPLKFTDPLGLAIWLCNRQVTIGPGVGNHAYIWNDKTKTCCGRNQGHDPLKTCKEKGPEPGGDSCVLIPGSEGKEDELFKCCQETANDGTWLPFKNDCHDSVERCLKNKGLRVRGAPGGRMGSCDSCWVRPLGPNDPTTTWTGAP